MPQRMVTGSIDADLLGQARGVHAGLTDSELIEAALQALIREHPDGEVDLAYLRAYREVPVEAQDAWGDLTAFLDAARR